MAARKVREVSEGMGRMSLRGVDPVSKGVRARVCVCACCVRVSYRSPYGRSGRFHEDLHFCIKKPLSFFCGSV